jgi:NADPH:quinone reductase-like Zn-dependent oxidoreductase
MRRRLSLKHSTKPTRPLNEFGQCNLEKTMARHVRFHETGGPEVLKIEEVPTPEPNAGEVRISVRALGLNRAESMYRTGRYVIEPAFPATMGYEASGVIDAIGPEVEGLAVGDAVAVIPAFRFDQYGLYGDLVIAPARAVVKNPDGVSWESAAAMWMPFTTAWGALIDLANLRRGDFVVLSAASSSVGLAAMQIAKSVGATPIAITRNGEKTKELWEAGFAHILQTGVGDITAEIMRITDGAGARLVFDPVGGPTFESIVKATSKDAIVFIYGALSHDVTPVPVLHVLGKHTTIRGYEFIEVTADDEKLTRAKAFITEGLSNGKFSPQIARVFPFEEIVEATRYLESNAQFGKIVVKL